MQRIFLPGASEQLKHLAEKLDLTGKSIVVLGSNSEQIAKALAEKIDGKVELIVEDYESLINSELIITRGGNVALKMMAFDSTDYQDQSFDLVYAQASISGKTRNKIVKEIKRILKPGGHLCVGEIVQLTEHVPTFVKNMWDTSALSPLKADNIKSYYEERNFKVIYEVDLNSTLKIFYSMAQGSLKDQMMKLTDEEKSTYKKLLNKISHESNVYLHQGGDKHMGFKTMLLEKI